MDDYPLIRESWVKDECLRAALNQRLSDPVLSGQVSFRDGLLPTIISIIAEGSAGNRGYIVPH